MARAYSGEGAFFGALESPFAEPQRRRHDEVFPSAPKRRGILRAWPAQKAAQNEGTEG